MNSRRWAVLGAIILLGLTASSTSVSADQVVIDFEDFLTMGPGQGGQVVVSNQYADEGITFNNPEALDYSKGDAIQGFAHSGTKAIEQCYSKEFCTTPIEMSFTRAQMHIKVWVGFSGQFDERRTVILRAFDISGNEVGNATAIIDLKGSPHPIQIPLEVVSQSADITRAVVRFSPNTILMNGLAVDDVEFEAPSIPVEPRHPRLAVFPDSLDFDSFGLYPNQLSDYIETRTLTITNEGNADLTVDIEVTGGPFILSESSVIVTPGSSKDIEVEFTPRDYRSWLEVAYIRSNDPDNPQLGVELRGEVYLITHPPWGIMRILFFLVFVVVILMLIKVLIKRHPGEFPINIEIRGGIETIQNYTPQQNMINVEMRGGIERLEGKI